MVRRWKLPARAGFARALFALTFGLSVTDFASAQAPPPNPDAAPLTIDVQDDPALSPRRDLPQGSGATIVGTLEDGVGSQGSAVSGNTVVSSPNLTPTLLSQTASSVTVITAEQIQQRGQINVGEVLRSVPGIDVVRNSTPGSPTTIFIRGAGGEHTKVLVDGIPMNDPISPGRVFDFSNLSVDNIEK
ncbi:MAG: TonB-dependent receptor, partial [Planctomycetales bacterium]|nr:TonB-dependent receptor [Planctomycetales bacterium]